MEQHYSLSSANITGFPHPFFFLGVMARFPLLSIRRTAFFLAASSLRGSVLLPHSPAMILSLPGPMHRRIQSINAYFRRLRTPLLFPISRADHRAPSLGLAARGGFSTVSGNPARRLLVHLGPPVPFLLSRPPLRQCADMPFCSLWQGPTSGATFFH